MSLGCDVRCSGLSLRFGSGFVAALQGLGSGSQGSEPQSAKLTNPIPHNIN